MLTSTVRGRRSPARNGDLGPGATAPVQSARTGPRQSGTEPPQAPSVGPWRVASADWSTLLDAVKARIRHVVTNPPSASGAPARDDAGPLRDDVRECVSALDQLQATLEHELGLRQRLELELFDARTALAGARAELAGTQAGERRARHLALHDGLTSLPNREHFRQRLDDALTPGQPVRKPLAVLYLDLDGFKSVNDAHGHDTGDELLRIVAARLTRAVRAGDMVSRLGGDEFACVLADLPSRQQLCQLACKLFDSVSAPVTIGRLKVAVRPSIGVAICPADGLTTDLLLKSADAAMYRAKRARTGYAFCERDDA